MPSKPPLIYLVPLFLLLVTSSTPGSNSYFPRESDSLCHPVSPVQLYYVLPKPSFMNKTSCQKSLLCYVMGTTMLSEIHALLPAITVFLSEITVVLEITTLLKITVLTKITTLFRNPYFPVKNPWSPIRNSCSPDRDPCFLSEVITFPLGNCCSWPDPSLYRIFGAVCHALTLVAFL